jgi:cullin-associated NEDD8-dissociated protein 1
VKVGTEFEFRNPVHFVQFTDLNVRDAEYETEAVLDHLFFHDNTAPFVAHRLIQRFTSSNPSPRYVTVVADAFRTGTYGGTTYSGKYGDLGATIEAILRYREARNPMAMRDPHHGKLREPVVKLTHMFRAMEFEPKLGQEIEFSTIRNMIGQEPYQAPSVFNFYLPSYQAPGAVENALLTAPEAQLATAPFLVGYLNGLRSLIDNGLTHFNGGFGGGYVQMPRERGREGERERGRGEGDRGGGQNRDRERPSQTVYTRGLLEMK